MSSSDKNNGMTSRRSACLSCRSRKVRCDGKKDCQNCLRRGSDCVFVVDSDRDKDDMLVMIKQLNERLSQAEKSLETRATPTLTNTPNVERAESSAGPDFSEFWIPDDRHTDMFPDLHAPLSSAWQDMNTASVFASDSLVDDMNGAFPTDALDQFDYDISQGFSNPVAVGDFNYSNGTSVSLTDELYVNESISRYTSSTLTCAMDFRFRLYFDLEDHACFMLDRESFISTMKTSPLGPELLGLKSIVFAHASSSSPAYHAMRTDFYEASRQHFEIAETGQSFNTIAALQTCILLAMYELKNLLFTRAWGRVSRALWMAKIFGLSRMDTATPGLRQPRSPLPGTADPAELEERRRTFWSAFILGCFTSTSAGWDVHSLVGEGELQITTLLPSFDSSAQQRLDLTSILHSNVWSSEANQLSPFQALIISSALYRRCLGHAGSAL